MLIDSLLKEEFRYEIYLCKPSDYSIIACLTECTIDRTIKRQLKSIDEFEFTIPRYWDDTSSEVNTYFDSVIAGSIILVESLIDDVVQERMYFKVVEPQLVIDEREYKVIKCYSLQYQWGKIRIKGFTSESDDGSTTTTQLYDANTPWDDANPINSGIINYILEEKLLGTWTVNSMSTSLIGLYRTFDIADNSLLEVIEDIQNNFNCVITFDTYNRKIDILDYNDLPAETGLILHDENFIKKLQQTIKIDEIVTRLYIDGDNDEASGMPKTIISKNITRQPYIDDFTYFRNSTYMSQGLRDKLTTLDAKILSKVSDFDDLQDELTALQLLLTTYRNELAVLDGGQFDINNNLIADGLQQYEAKEDAAIKAGGNYAGHTYDYWHTLVVSQTLAVNAKQAQIDTLVNTTIPAKEAELATLGDTLTYEHVSNGFTTAQLQELLNFINEETVKCSSSDPTELLSFGTALLTRKANPPIEFELDIVDLFDSKELSYTWDKLVLGAKVDLVSDTFNISESPRVVSYTHNPDKCTLSVTVSNKEYLNSDLDYITALFTKSKQGADTIKKEREVYKDYVVNDKDTINNFITSPIDASANKIIMSDNGIDASYIDRRGMYMKDIDSDLGQMKILGNRIVFTRDNWANYSLAITPNGIQTDGGFKLISQTKYGGNNLVTIDGNGIKIYGSGTTTDSIEIFNKNNVKTFGLDSNGNVNMYYGTITWANVNTDPVASGAASTANSALTAAQNIANGTYSGGTLISNKNIYSPTILNTKVGITDNDASGKAVGEVGYSALDTDIRIWAGKSYNDRATAPFRVTQGGALVATNATITGTINANAGTFSGSITSSATITGGTIQTASSGARTVITLPATANDYSIYGKNSANALHGLAVNPNWADLILFQNGIEMFRVENTDFGSQVVHLMAYGDYILGYNNTQNKTYVKGTWSFSDPSCVIEGLQVKFS